MPKGEQQQVGIELKPAARNAEALEECLRVRSLNQIICPLRPDCAQDAILRYPPIHSKCMFLSFPLRPPPSPPR